jgi:hypothetical protein
VSAFSLVAEVCFLFQGWTVDLVLRMPAVHFFEMLRHGRRLRAYQLAELCDVAAITICQPKYHTQLKQRLLSLATDRTMPKPPPPLAHMDAGSREAADLFFQMFAAKKGQA